MESSSRTTNSKKSIIMGIAKNLVMTLVAFISRRLFIYYIGVEYLGINGLFANTLSLLSMADLGFGTAMSFSFYKPLANHDEEKLSSLIWFYKKVYRIIAILITLLGIALIPFLKYIVNVEQEIPHLTLYYLIFLSSTVFSYLFIYKSSIITADQKKYIVDSITVIVLVCKLIIQCICIVVFRNYVIYILLNLTATIVNNLIVSHKADEIYPFIKQKRTLNKKEQAEIFDNLRSVFIYKISSTLINSIDNIIISVMISTIAVGYYSNYLTITLNLSSFITIIFTSLTASVGNLIVKESFDRKYEIFAVSQKISFWISGFVSVSTFVLVSDFIQLWLGSEFDLGIPMAAAVSLNLFFSTSMQPIWVFREATGLYKKTKYVMLVTAFINLILSILLARIWGLPGVVFATVASRILTYFWYEPKLLFGEFFHRSAWIYYREFLLNSLFVVVLSWMIVFIFRNWTLNQSIIQWVFKAVIVCLIINSAYALIGIKNGTIREVAQRILR